MRQSKNLKNPIFLARRQLRLSQVEFAKWFQLDAVSISHYENDRTKPNYALVQMLELLCALCPNGILDTTEIEGVTPSEFVQKVIQQQQQRTN